MGPRHGKFNGGGSRLSGVQVVGVDLLVPQEGTHEVGFVLRSDTSR